MRYNWIRVVMRWVLHHQSYRAWTVLLYVNRKQHTENRILLRHKLWLVKLLVIHTCRYMLTEYLRELWFHFLNIDNEVFIGFYICALPCCNSGSWVKFGVTCWLANPVAYLRGGDVIKWIVISVLILTDIHLHVLCIMTNP